MLEINLLSGHKIAKELRDKSYISVFGVPFFSRPLMLNDLSKYLYVCPDYFKAGQIMEQLSSLSKNTVYLPAIDDPLSHAASAGGSVAARLAALHKIATGSADIVVTTAAALTQLYPKKDDILSHSVNLKKGGTYGTDSLVKRLIAAGYKRVAQTGELGEFSLRGDILDVTPPGLGGVRIDFFDDTVEKISLMDFETQLSGGELSEVSICPFCEVFTGGFDFDSIKKYVPKATKNPPPRGAEGEDAIRSSLSALVGELSFRRPCHLNFLKPLFNQTPITALFDCPIIFDESKQTTDNFFAHLSEGDARFKSMLERGEAFSFESDAFMRRIPLGRQNVTFDRLLCQNRIFAPASVLNFKDLELPSYATNKQELLDDIRGWNATNKRVKIVCTGRLKENISDLLAGSGAGAQIIDGTLFKGGCFFDDNLILIGSGDLTAKAKTLSSAKAKGKKVFFTPNIGDYVVHATHGIGVCEGISRMQMGGGERDYIIIAYAGGDKLYVAAENLTSLSLFAGGESPKLNKIGGLDFSRLKEKARASIKKLAFDLQQLYAKRENLKGYKYPPDFGALSEFEAAFPYEETDCQRTAIDDTIADLSSGKIMDRLLCGDVGYGKTEVALRAAYKVILGGKQVAFISPTTILARQHYLTVKKRMEPFGVNIGSLTRFDSKADIAKTVRSLAEGSVDIVCGTHRVLSKDVSFADLGMLVLDEEQRFGVGDKDKIKLLKNDINVLSLSATPIPRTLHLSLSGIRDISILDEPPKGRLPISTYVSEYTESLVFDAVTREAGRGGQTFIVYNRVEKIDAFASTIINLFPDLKVAVIHGQMEERLIENALLEFASGTVHILVASTIIENGIDFPNANTLIVVDADKLGLSQLYQLRGRIGRGAALAYAYFTFDGKKTLTENAYKRLEAVMSYTDLGSGFKLAMRDLEIRGAGNVLGREQHGHMQSVGYDMYLKLMDEVMRELKGEKEERDIEPSVVTDLPAFIAEDYIPDINWRMKAYKRIAAVTSVQESAQIINELKDVYGTAPIALKNLLYIALIKNLAAAAGIEKIVLNRTKCELFFGKGSTITLEAIKSAMQYNFTLSAPDNRLWTLSKSDTNRKLLDFLLSLGKTT